MAGPLPAYPGATVTSHIGDTTVLHSYDGVGKVGAFHAATPVREGRSTTSEDQGSSGANFVARPGGPGSGRPGRSGRLGVLDLHLGVSGWTRG